MVMIVEIVRVAQRWASGFVQSSQRIEWLKDLFSALAGLGTAAAAYFGYAEKSPVTIVIGGTWFVGANFGAYLLAKQLEALDETSATRESVRHRKMAGTVRSIVRSELAKTFEKPGAEQQS